MGYLAYRHLGDLPADRAGYVAYLDDLARNMEGAGMLANSLPETVPEGVVQRDPVPEAHKKHDPDVSLPLLTHHQAFQHLGELLHLAVDLGGPDAYPARVARGIT